MTHPHLVDCTMFWGATSGGVRRYLQAKRNWLLRRAAWQHSIVAPGAQGRGLVDCGGFALPFSGGYRCPLDRDAVAKLIVKRGPDVIEAGDPYRLAWAALDAARRMRIPAVAFCHSNVAALAAQWAGGNGLVAWCARRAAERYLARTYRQFDLVLAPSPEVADQLRALDVPRVQMQPLGVDTMQFHPSRRDPLWRKTLGLPDDARLLLYAGRFAVEKNLPVLADAVRRLGPRWYLLALGAGPRVPSGKQVRVLPYEAREPQLARIYASVDAFVHAGDQETFGLAALEAMACGTPAIMRNAGGLAEFVAGGAGIGVSSGRAADWAEALAAFFAGERETWSQRARAWAEKRDWNVVLPALLRHYQRLLAVRPQGDNEVTQPAVLWRSGSLPVSHKSL